MIKTTNLYSVALREWSINRSDRGFSVGGVYYIRVSSQDTTEPCTFTIVYRILHVQANYLYTGKKHHMVSTNERVAISYYRINLQNKTEATTGGYFSVKRNSYYQIKVNQINNIGWPYPNDLVDPSDSEEAEDNRVGIDATVNVQAWKVIEQDSSLQ